MASQYPPRFYGPEGYHIDVKVPDFSILPTGETLPPDGFLIAYTVKDNIKCYNYENDQWVLNRISYGSVHTNLSFHTNRETLVPAGPEISSMLDEVINIPMEVKGNFIQFIQEAIAPIAIHPVYASPRLVPILVEITTWYNHDVSNILSFLSDDDVDVNDAIIEQIHGFLNYLYSEEIVPRATPAARSAVQLLPKVTIDAVNYEQTECVICLEDFVKDVQLISMPCNHVFHEECITKWLQNRNVCPICRVQMPVDPSE